MATFKKGSKEAKAHMAKIRAMRNGKKTVKKTVKKSVAKKVTKKVASQKVRKNPATKVVPEYKVLARHNTHAGQSWQTIARFPKSEKGKSDAKEYAEAYYDKHDGNVAVKVES